jgi:hypothetical protein
MSCCRDVYACLVRSRARKHGPRDAGKLIGKCGSQNIVVQSFGCRGEPWTEAMLRPVGWTQ